jgi:uncharacterized protein (DUF433 family)
MITAETLIRRTPGVVGGDACVRETRIAVWMLVEAQRLGRDDAELLEDYPGLTADDLRAAWEYAAAHRTEIEEAIRANEAA